MFRQAVRMQPLITAICHDTVHEVCTFRLEALQTHSTTACS